MKFAWTAGLLVILFATAPLAAAQGEATEDDDNAESSGPLPLVQYLPLGDITGNGTAELLEWSHTGDTPTSRAISLSDPSNPIWETDQPLFPFGDLNGDGRLDVRSATDFDFGDGSSCNITYAYVVYTYDCSLRATTSYSVLSGTDLDPLASLEATSRSEYASTSTLAVAASVTNSNTVAEGHNLYFANGEPATIELVGSSYNDDLSYVFAPGAFALTYDSSSQVMLGRSSLDGSIDWTGTFGVEDQWTGIVGDEDINADAVGDYLLLSTSDTSYTYGYAGITSLPLLADPNIQYLVQAVDGRTGTPTTIAQPMERTPGPTTVMATNLGNIHGDGNVILVMELQPTPDLTGFQSVLRTFSSSGTILSTDTFTNELVTTAPFADVDGDGKDEMFLLRAPITCYVPLADCQFDLAQSTFDVIRADLTSIWSVPDFTNNAPLYGLSQHLAPDLNGDGVPEYLGVDERGEQLKLNAYSGKDGQAMWTTSENPDWLWWGLLDDASGDGGVDIVSGTVNGWSEGDFGNVTEHSIALTVEHGATLERLWERTVYDPATINKTLGENEVYLGTAPLGDVNGDGAEDISFTFTEDQAVQQCDEDGWCEWNFTVEDDYQYSAVFSGADGSLLALHEVVAGIKTPWPPVDDESLDALAPPTESLEEKDTPFPAVPLALALAVMVAVRRKH